MDKLRTKYKACIEACLRAHSAAQFCAAACLKEEHLHMMRNCIQLDNECATICLATASLLNMQSPFVFSILPLCAEICASCAAECEKHDNEHCQQCAVLCKHCAEECRQLAA
ncbi:MAG TPA: four-helix bundle copper-binding protein [Flavihumibacter sp.]|jgi:hypothetical protein